MQLVELFVVARYRPDTIPVHPADRPHFTDILPTSIIADSIGLCPSVSDENRDYTLVITLACFIFTLKSNSIIRIFALDRTTSSSNSFFRVLLNGFISFFASDFFISCRSKAISLWLCENAWDMSGDGFWSCSEDRNESICGRKRYFGLPLCEAGSEMEGSDFSGLRELVGYTVLRSTRIGRRGGLTEAGEATETLESSLERDWTRW